MAQRHTGEHWPVLDGLRGLAVAGVVAYHLGWLPGGFLGVDLFFALSGFLITTLLIGTFDPSTPPGRSWRGDLAALGRFWARRARRLMPAVALLVIVVLGWLAAWGTPSQQALARTDAAWALPYLANWHLVAMSRDYWGAVTEASVFNHLWSLAIEEQFYVVWPVVVCLALRGRRAVVRLGVVTVALAVASLATTLLLAGADQQGRIYFGTDTRALALLAGALAALPPVRAATVRWVGRAPRAGDAVVVVSGTAIAVLRRHHDGEPQRRRGGSVVGSPARRPGRLVFGGAAAVARGPLVRPLPVALARDRDRRATPRRVALTGPRRAGDRRVAGAHRGLVPSRRAADPPPDGLGDGSPRRCGHRCVAGRGGARHRRRPVGPRPDRRLRPHLHHPYPTQPDRPHPHAHRPHRHTPHHLTPHRLTPHRRRPHALTPHDVCERTPAPTGFNSQTHR
jgi:hypothetical protein